MSQSIEPGRDTGTTIATPLRRMVAMAMLFVGFVADLLVCAVWVPLWLLVPLVPRYQTGDRGTYAVRPLHVLLVLVLGLLLTLCLFAVAAILATPGASVLLWV